MKMKFNYIQKEKKSKLQRNFKKNLKKDLNSSFAFLTNRNFTPY